MNLVRRGLERLVRNKVIRRRIYVRGRKVELYVSPDAQLKYLKIGANAFDADLIKIAETFISPSDCVWDIGANVGMFTFASGSIAVSGTVISLEPDIWLAALLRQSSNLRQNMAKDIRVLPVAASDIDGLAEFQISARGRASSALVSARNLADLGGVRDTHYVPCVKLDTILQTMPKPTFIKIDAEGAELMVLSGATEVIRTARPVFYIEVSKDHFEDTHILFEKNNYASFDSRGHQTTKATDENYFFIPNERRECILRVQDLHSN